MRPRLRRTLTALIIAAMVACALPCAARLRMTALIAHAAPLPLASPGPSGTPATVQTDRSMPLPPLPTSPLKTKSKSTPPRTRLAPIHKERRETPELPPAAKTKDNTKATERPAPKSATPRRNEPGTREGGSVKEEPRGNKPSRSLAPKARRPKPRKPVKR
jgi:hypothetical protein